jgi:uncharacterized protein (TIGR02246 family)
MRLLLLLVVILAASSAAVMAQRSEPSAEEKAIRATAVAFDRAFNAHDAKAVAALWTRDGEYVDETGRVFSGREAIEKEYASFFKQRPKAQIQTVVDSVRIVGPNIAFEEGTTRLLEPPVGATSTGRYSVVHVKQDGKWLMASVRDLASAALSNYELLRELEPLVGNWTASGPQGRVETSCEWIENRNFLRRRYTTYRDDKEVGSGFEIIGVDPSIGAITSWQFSADGAIGRNLWAREGNHWVIEAHGTMPNGTPTAALNILTPVNNDTFTWRSTNRSVNGEPAQDAPIVKLVRKK